MAAQPPVWDPFDNPFYGPIHPLTPPIRPYVYPAPRPKPHWLRALEKRVNSNPFIAIPYWLSVWGLKLSWRMLKALFRSIRKRRQMV